MNKSYEALQKRVFSYKIDQTKKQKPL